MAAHHASDLVPHPKIFVYNSTPDATRLFQFVSAQGEAELINWAFGSSITSTMRATDTWATASILIYRLVRNPSWRTSDPAKADLFIIPVLPRHPTYQTADTDPSDFKDAVKHTCDHLFLDDLQQHYEHLNEETARAHIVTAVEYTPILAFCAMHGGYAMRPRSLRLLQRMRWFIHEDFEPSRSAPVRHYSLSPGLPGTMSAMAVTIPFPSGVANHRETLAQMSHRRRPYLLSFSGSGSGSPENRLLRQAISRQCRRHGSPSCMSGRVVPGMEMASDSIVRIYQLKQSSTFCAEPGGHNRIRKGVADAVLSGCIPIVFLRPQHARRFWPWHLFGWRNQSMLTLHPETFVSRGTDLVAMLQAIPAVQVQAMQRSLFANARRIAYLVNQAEGDDALSIALKGMAFGLPG